jgi:hypothetical protein
MIMLRHAPHSIWPQRQFCGRPQRARRGHPKFVDERSVGRPLRTPEHEPIRLHRGAANGNWQPRDGPEGSEGSRKRECRISLFMQVRRRFGLSLRGACERIRTADRPLTRRHMLGGVRRTSSARNTTCVQSLGPPCKRRVKPRRSGQRRARRVPMGPVNHGNSRSIAVIATDVLTCRNAVQSTCTRSLPSGRGNSGSSV